MDQVLENIPGIKDPKELSRFERIVTSNRIMELEDTPIWGKFNLKHLQDIHKYIFKDVYFFAGQIRNVDISKGFHFAHHRFIQTEAYNLFQDLKNENYLQGLNLNDFSERAAHYMAEINVLHPFREGNGRSQREFIRTLGINAGYEIQWSKVDTDRLFNASVKSKFDTKDLAEVIKDTIINKEPDKELIKFFRDLQPDRGLER